MRALIHGLLAIVLAVATSGVSGAMAQSPLIQPPEWQAYKTQFLLEDGRIVDSANGGISHSEGQGYGLLLSVLAESQGDFESVWRFTRDELMVRGDGLSAWRWEANRKPHVTDRNNATDGDILIAYALLLADRLWPDEARQDVALQIIRTTGKTLVGTRNGYALILPGSAGFSPADREDGPVINLSYWVFEALDAFAAVDTNTDWSAVAQSGRDLVAALTFGEPRLPPDWVSAKSRKWRAANDLPFEFGYNGIRIPLYLLRAGVTDRTLLEPFSNFWNREDGPATWSFANESPVDPLREPGYRIIGAGLDCILDQTPVPEPLRQFAPESYYGSTLHLLTLAFLREHAPQCL